jgi:hypothetical protein
VHVSFFCDPEFAEVIVPLAYALTANAAPAGDWKTLRETVSTALAVLAAATPDVTGVRAAD